ncbi:MAG TPA: DUF5606 domain-containing protein [Bacteroidales bacterium]|nr:DUF5606 domain-containing protein [Bacteroidales bacterium]
MDLSNILAITGKSGLFKVASKTKNGLIVESLLDGKKMPVFLNDRSSALADISIFTNTGDVPLKEVLLKIFEKENGGPSIDPKESSQKLQAYFESILPDYDKKRVFDSDLKKLFAWYQLLLDKNMIVPEEAEKETEEKSAETEAQVKTEAETKTKTKSVAKQKK